MLRSETYLLTAVRDRIRTELSIQDEQCRIEPDEIVPAVGTDFYVAVIPAGMSGGPTHNQNDAVFDLYLSVKVVCYQKIGNVPRDRRRDVFLERLTGLNARLDKIMYAIDKNRSVVETASNLLQVEVPLANPFIEPLRFVSLDSKPRAVVASEYDGTPDAQNASNPVVALARGVTFGRARIMETIQR